MPKKFGTNSKKEEARERETQKKKEKREDEIRKAEDAFWRETDSKVIKKLDKERDEERKRQEALKRKQDNKEAVEREMQELSTKQTQNKAPTRREIQEHKERTLKRLLEQNKDQKQEEIEQIDVEKEFVNPNYIQKEKYNEKGQEIIDVTGVDEALSELSLTELDKHPEKRLKAAWNAYFETQLPIFKAEYPNAKRSQLIEMIQKEFKKSPDNPVYRQQLINMREAEK